MGSAFETELRLVAEIAEGKRVEEAVGDDAI